jgi:hypothetical protein
MTGGLYDYSFVHLIARHNRNSGSIAELMPTSQVKIAMPLSTRFHHKFQ